MRFVGYTDAQWAAIAAAIDPRGRRFFAEYLSLARTREFLTSIAVLHASVRVRWGEPRKGMHKLRATLASARAALDSEQVSEAAGRRARTTLDAVLSDIAQPRMGNKNAVQMHVRYWRELARYYGKLQPGHSPKQLIAFMDACSRPVFPRKTTLEAVSSFAYRFGKRRRV